MDASWELGDAWDELGTRKSHPGLVLLGTGQTGGKGAESQQKTWKNAVAQRAGRDGISSASPAAGAGFLQARNPPACPGSPTDAQPDGSLPRHPAVTRVGETEAGPDPTSRDGASWRSSGFPSRLSDVGHAGSHGPFLPLAGRGAKRKNPN